MSRRQINPVIAPYDLRLWHFDSFIVPFTAASQVVSLSGAEGTSLVEFVFIEADLANTDFIAIGMKNVQLFAAATTGTKCFTQLLPGDSLRFQQSQSSMFNGRLTAHDGDIAALSMAPELERIDLSSFFGLSGPNFIPNTLHITIGSRTR